MSLLNKVAIVTGASSGIGAAIAVQLAEKGARVAIVGRNETKLNNTSKMCSERGVKPLTIVADVTRDDDVKRIITETLNFFGKLDILINNAGGGTAAGVMDDCALSVFDNIMATNLVSVVHLTHLAAKHLIATKGNIVNISSIASQAVMSRKSFAYGTSKAALDHFTRCVASGLASSGVRVNSVNPGPVKTDILQNGGVPKSMEDDIWEMMQNCTALNRVADSEEIADLVVFLVSDKARSITGSIMVTDNGALVKGINNQSLF